MKKKMFEQLQTIAKALAAFGVAAGAAYAGAQFGVVIPGEVQGWVADTAGVLVAGLIGGGLVWAIPNTKPINPVKKMGRPKKAI